MHTRLFTPKQPTNDSQFSEKQHIANLEKGFYEIVDHTDHIYLTNLHAQPTHSGFGTAVFRELMTRSFAKNKDGNIKLFATNYSHLFYLYMGMTAIDWTIPYLVFHHGPEAVYLSDKLFAFDKFNIFENAILNKIIENEFNVDANNLSLLDKTEFCNKLKILNETHYSFLKDQYIPALINHFETNPEKPFYFADTHMMMSETGKKTWENTIKFKQAFTPFKFLQHLHADMRPQQAEFFQDLSLKNMLKTQQLRPFTI